MDLLPTPEQTEIIDSSSAFLLSKVSVEQSRALFEAGTVPSISHEAWSAAAELGWFALGLPEGLNGIGCGLADEVLLFREIGRGLAPGPFLSTVLGARVAAFAGNQGLADDIAAGRRVGLVIPDTLASIAGDGSVVGSVQLVDADPDGLVLAVTSTVAALVEVSTLAGLTQVPCLDLTARLHRATGAGAAPLAAVAAAVDPLELRGHVLAAALLAGITEWARDTGDQASVRRHGGAGAARIRAGVVRRTRRRRRASRRRVPGAVRPRHGRCGCRLLHGGHAADHGRHGFHP
jgi:hypothetical protein